MLAKQINGVKKNKTKKFHVILIVLLSTVFTFLFAEGVFRIVNMNNSFRFLLVDQPGRKVGLYEFDEALGWKNRPNFNKKFQWPHRNTLERINSLGWRDKEYKFRKDKDLFRIAIIGCSRTYGYGVNMEETYSKELEKMLNDKFSQKFEVMNFGVNGYGLSQMTQNYLKNVRKYSPDLVILQFYMPTVYRATQISMWSTSKPAYILKNGEIALINSPVPDDKFRPIERWLVDKSYLYKFVKDKLLKMEEIRKYKFKSEVANNKNLHNICSKILAYLKNQASQDGSQLVVFTWGKEVPQWIDSLLTKGGVEHFVLEDFGNLDYWKKLGNTENPPPTGHWSPLGHKFVAQSIMNYLDANMFAKNKVVNLIKGF